MWRSSSSQLHFDVSVFPPCPAQSLRIAVQERDSARAVLETLKLERTPEVVCLRKGEVGDDLENPGQSSQSGVKREDH